jgi:hypothetical protein
MAFVTLTRSDIERLLPMSACIEVMWRRWSLSSAAI